MAHPGFVCMSNFTLPLFAQGSFVLLGLRDLPSGKRLAVSFLISTTVSSTWLLTPLWRPAGSRNIFSPCPHEFSLATSTLLTGALSDSRTKEVPCYSHSRQGGPHLGKACFFHISEILYKQGHKPKASRPLWCQTWLPSSGLSAIMTAAM